MLPQSTGLYSMGATLLKLDHPSLWHERKTPSASRGRKKACTHKGVIIELIGDLEACNKAE